MGSIFGSGQKNNKQAMKHENTTYTYTYADPASVRQMIDAKGDGYGIQNTQSGLFVVNERHQTGKTYPKGTVFWVCSGSVRAVWG